MKEITEYENKAECDNGDPDWEEVTERKEMSADTWKELTKPNKMSAETFSKNSQPRNR